jgi:hypothetical protein
MRACLFMAILCVTLLPAQPAPETAAAIMEKVAANVERAAEARSQYVYQQRVRSSLIRGNGQLSRKEEREYSVIPGEKGTEKKLVSFVGLYRKGKNMLSYPKPGFKYKENDIDGELIEEFAESLVNDKQSRDGIPHSLFPMRSKDLEIWIDAADLQPARIQTELAFSIPWGVRVFLGTNFRQMGFSISYHRAGDGVWFPATYGTEFRFNVLWAYKRTITLSLESTGFQKTAATSTIEYDLPKQ